MLGIHFTVRRCSESSGKQLLVVFQRVKILKWCRAASVTTNRVAGDRFGLSNYRRLDDGVGRASEWSEYAKCVLVVAAV